LACVDTVASVKSHHRTDSLPKLRRRPYKQGIAYFSVLCSGFATAQSSSFTPPALVLAQAQGLAQQAAVALAPAGARVVAVAGALDARLQLAPCAAVTPYLTAGAPAWGRTRVGLRCTEGAAWNVQLPVQVQVWADAVVSKAALPAGARLSAEQLTLANVDWALGNGQPHLDISAVAGRVLARPLAAGTPLRTTDLQNRQWFAAGDTVQIVAQGPGFAVTSEGQALAPGLEGQPVRVRTESGRIVTGRAVGDKRLELSL
jgi:flagellar basal body P-ring formation protein FlgA